MSSGSSPSTFLWATGSSRDDTKGLVAVTFNEPSGLGGETATLSERHGDVFTEDAFDNAVLSDVLVPGGIDFFFSDVDLTEALVVTPIGVDGANI